MGEWVAAGDLEVGDYIQTADGTLGAVEALETARTAPMYNLTVDTAHTYFVGAGQWLVHNSCAGKVSGGWVGEGHSLRTYLQSQVGIDSGNISPKTIIDLGSEVHTGYTLESLNDLGRQLFNILRGDT